MQCRGDADCVSDADAEPKERQRDRQGSAISTHPSFWLKPQFSQSHGSHRTRFERTALTVGADQSDLSGAARVASAWARQLQPGHVQSI
jgi:hypothetical protein